MLLLLSSSYLSLLLFCGVTWTRSPWAAGAESDRHASVDIDRPNYISPRVDNGGISPERRDVRPTLYELLLQQMSTPAGVGNIVSSA